MHALARLLLPAIAVLPSGGLTGGALAQEPPPRARDLGLPFDGRPGPWNAITDVAGVRVGQVTLIAGEGEHAVRTGVTAIVPGTPLRPRFAGFHRHNGDGELTGMHYVEEKGLLESPILLTNTVSVGDVASAVIRWSLRASEVVSEPILLPVVGETWDGELNDILGFHVQPEHVFAALDGARGGAVDEGNTGGGTGMICHGFKGGTGTASRVLGREAGGYTVGVLVQANHGTRRDLRIAGILVGREVGAESGDAPADAPRSGDGSIVVVIATDAPLLPHQLRRVAARAGMGLARNGSFSSTWSGDLFLAFSTAPPGAASAELLAEERLDPLFRATVQATEEAIVNALVAARTMSGRNGLTVEALPHGELRRILARHAVLAADGGAGPAD